ncbi:MAG: efflux RND transporter periplasmic adaptor subunit [Acidobacteria bacterium]|nr:efflux RND transporter periplasmic adaptor subunit [Acidobacteriota bacterium]
MSTRAFSILAALALGLAACGGHETKEAPAPDLGPTRDVTTAEVQRVGEEGEVAVPGIVRARQHAALSARIPASVAELPVQVGQWVEAGTVVVRLDATALRAALAAAEAGREAAEADLERTKSLLEKGAATPRELEQMKAHAAGAEAQVTGARDNLSYAVLRAPFAGRVAERPVNLGDVVNPGMPLIVIEGQGGLEVRASVAPGIAALLRPGMKIQAQCDGQPAPLDATLSAVAPAGDPTTHRVEVKATVPSARGLRAGLFARLIVPAPEGEARIRVPASAVFARGGLNGLFVAEDGTARLRWVALGARTGDAVEIRAGLEAGERVVLDPTGLVEGAPIRERPVTAGAGAAPAEER